jgi:hypothetical protein
LLVLVPAAPVAFGKDGDGVRRRGTPEAPDRRAVRRLAIRRGCEFLCGEPGSVPGSPGYRGRQRDDGGFGETNAAVVALTALSALALMADGSTDGRGPHGKAVTRGLDFLLRLIASPKPDRYPKGYFWFPEDGTSRMHGQGYATLALATALGTSKGERANEIREALIHAVACIEQAQTSTGGFGYEPSGGANHEGSVTVTVAQGLRAARDAGIIVNKETVQKGLHYLKRSQARDGSFQYSLGRPQTTYALTAAALSSFFLYGRYEDDPPLRIGKAIEFMRSQLRDGRNGVNTPWYYYGHFYAAWAAWQWDGHSWTDDGDNLWGWWQGLVYPDLLERQKSDGSFAPEEGRHDFGPVLSTSLAVLTLSIPDEVIPVFQR